MKCGLSTATYLCTERCICCHSLFVHSCELRVKRVMLGHVKCQCFKGQFISGSNSRKVIKNREPIHKGPVLYLGNMSATAMLHIPCHTTTGTTEPLLLLLLLLLSQGRCHYFYCCWLTSGSSRSCGRVVVLVVLQEVERGSSNQTFGDDS